MPRLEDIPPGCSQVFALPGAAVLDIIEFCRVGSHNAGLREPSGGPHPEPWRAVREALAEVMAIAPFAIQFADAAGLWAMFLDPVTTERATQVGELILRENPEAMELAVDALVALGLPVPMGRDCPESPDYGAAMVEHIVRAGRFRMWWD